MSLKRIDPELLNVGQSPLHSRATRHGSLHRNKERQHMLETSSLVDQV